MKSQISKIAIGLIILGVLTGIGCGKKKNPVAAREISYPEVVSNGWSAFSVGNYPLAYQEFCQGKRMNPSEAEAYAGLGWTLMKMDSLPRADQEFSLGAIRTNVSADLFAGWAFLMNIGQNFTGSNEKIDMAIARDPNWVFIHWITLDVNDLRVMKAENYYLLGDFQQSLAILNLVNPLFQTDVTTTDGQAALAREIERLKLVS